MALIQKILRMQGVAIRTPRDFRDHFSPGDFLRAKELAAYFALRNLEMLSPVHTYYCALLNFAVTEEEGCCFDCRLPAERCIRQNAQTSVHGQLQAEGCPLQKKEGMIARNSIVKSGYWDKDKIANLPALDDNSSRILLEHIRKDPFHRAVLEQTGKLMEKTTLPSREKRHLKQILSLGYLLAGWLPEQRPISPEEAQAAYLGRSWKPEVTYRETEDARIYPARPEAYPVTLRSSTLLGPGETITLKKITAVPSAQGNTAMPVVLQLPDRQEILYPGEYRYASFVGQEMIRLYPLEKQNGGRSLRREKDHLLLTREDGTTLPRISCPDRDIVDFVPAAHKDAWILLTPDGMDYREFYDTQLPSGNIVEVRMKGNTVFLLTRFGEVLRHGKPTDIPPRTTLDGLREGALT